MQVIQIFSNCLTSTKFYHIYIYIYLATGQPLTGECWIPPKKDVYIGKTPVHIEFGTICSFRRPLEVLEVSPVDKEGIPCALISTLMKTWEKLSAQLWSSLCSFFPLQYSALQNLASLAHHILNSVASTEFPPRSCTVASKFFSDIIARAARGLTWFVFHPVGITVLPVVQCLNIVVPYSLPIFEAGE